MQANHTKSEKKIGSKREKEIDREREIQKK